MDKRTPFIFEDDILMSGGDTMTFSDINYVDTHWVERVYPADMQDIFWIRIHINVPAGFPTKEMAVKVIANASYEAYWDSRYIGKNGHLATDINPEIQGDYVKNFMLQPSDLSPGPHVLALRATTVIKQKLHHSYVIISDLDSIYIGAVRFSLWSFLLVGIFLTTALYFLVSFITNWKDLGAALFSIICFIVIALLVLEYVKSFYRYPYTFQHTRLVTINYLHMALSAIVPYFLMVQFELKNKWIVFTLLLIPIVLITINQTSYDEAAIAQNRLMWLASMGVMTYALLKKRNESVIILIALGASYMMHSVVRMFDFKHVAPYDVSIFLEYLILSLAMIYLTVYRRQKEKKAYEESLVTSERLRSELLRKNIRPHFIMNTLTSLIDWVEESPQEGVKFIKSLSNEFRLLNEMADHQLVHISEEIALCRFHLEVMEYRKDIKYIWHENNIKQTDYVPPAILLTMVENGVTHSYGANLKEVTFTLSYSEEDKFRIYRLFVQTNTHTPAKYQESKKGTGHKYITSRLQESYGSNWEYTSAPTTDGWINTIKIPLP